MTPYTLNMNKAMFKQIRKAISILIVVAFMGTSIKSPAFAQISEDPMPFMSKPGVMVPLSPEYTPAYLKGIVIHPENALKSDFIINKGDQILTDDQKRDEYTKLTKYFLASLAIPDDNQWVNLSPYEKDRIIKDDFGKTEMGRDLLAQDYMLKQITASLIYPEDNLGRKFWEKVYTEAQEQYGTTNIPVNTFNKVWILPDDALIYEKDNTAYVLRNHLRVMLEEDYLSLQKHAGIQSAPVDNKTHTIASKIIKEIVIPELEREVNEDKNFATVRQVYSGMLLATWYKRALKESLLSKIYANKSKVKGVDQDPQNNEVIYRQYLRAYKKGVFNFIKEDVDKYTNEIIPRKYFSGGGESIQMAAEMENRPVLGAEGTNAVIETTDNSAELAGENPSKNDLLILALGESKPIAEAAAREQGAVSPAMTAEKRTIVVADDEPSILEINTRNLEKQGFNVLTAASPAELDEVLVAAAKRGEKVSLLFTDSTGWIDSVREILNKIKSEFNSEIPIIAASGLNTMEDWKGVPVNAFLQKPYTRDDLLTEIYKILPKDAAMNARAGQSDDTFFAQRLVENRVRLTWELGEAIRFYLDRLKEQKPEVKNFEPEPMEQKEGKGGVSYIHDGSRWVFRGNESDYLNFLKTLGEDKTLFRDETLYKGFERLANSYLSGTTTPSKPDTAMNAAEAEQTLQNLSTGEQVGAVELMKALLNKTGYQGGRIYREDEFNGFVNSVKNLQNTNPSPALAHAIDVLQAKRPAFIAAINDNAGAGISDKAALAQKPDFTRGGIDFNAANLNLQIKRDGHGVPLPISQQDLENIHIDGLIPVIIDIKPATNLPIFSELQNTAS